MFNVEDILFFFVCMCLFNIQNQAYLFRSLRCGRTYERRGNRQNDVKFINNDHQLFAIFKEKPLFIYTNPKFKLL